MRFYILPLFFLATVSTLIAQQETRQENLIPYVSPYARGGSDLILDTAYSVQELISDFFSNSCVEPFNITMVGSAEGMGFFQAVGTELGVPAGILLSSGKIWNVKGPNNQGGAGNSFGKSGDEDLDLFAGQNTFDALTIHFDFIPSVEELTFRYVFASEEYPEYVCAIYNDIFGFFLSGPGLDGSYSNNAINIATLPDTSIYVGINSINPGVPGPLGNPVNCTNGSLDYGALYVDNTGGMHLQCDGFTMPLDAVVNVIPGEVYHAKIVVADAGDGIFDSSVFLSVESLCGDSLLHPIAQISKLEYTGPKSIAMNGWLKYGYDEWTWDFGDNSTKFKNQFSVTHTYAKPGLYTVKMYGSNYCCSDTFTLIVPIQLPPYLTKEVVRPVTCHGMANGRIDLDALSSYGDLTYAWSDGDTQPERIDLPPGEYTVTITDVMGQQTMGGPYVVPEPLPLEMELLQGQPGEEGHRPTTVIPRGGNGQYKFKWMDGSTSPERQDLIPGMDYSVTITDRLGCQQTNTFTYGSAQEKETQSNLLIYPNPASSQLRLSFVDLDATESGQILVYNALGQLQTSSKLMRGADLILPVEHWADGLYYLHLMTGTRREVRTIFIRH